MLYSINRLRPLATRRLSLPMTAINIRIRYSTTVHQVWSSQSRHIYTSHTMGCLLPGLLCHPLFGGIHSHNLISPALSTSQWIVHVYTVNPSYIALTLRQSNTDPFGAGVTLHVGRNNPPYLCCHGVAIILSQMTFPQLRSTVRSSDGSPLTRTQLVAAIKSAFIRWLPPNTHTTCSRHQVSTANHRSRLHWL